MTRRQRLDVAMIVGFAAVSASLALAPVHALDLALRDLADTHRSPLAYDIAVNLNRLGAGGWLALIALLLAITQVIRTRTPWPLLPVALAFVLTGAILTGLKWLLHRAPPHSGLPGDEAVMLFSDPAGLSYPSGHAVNTIVWYGVICALAVPWLNARVRTTLRIAPPIIVGVVSVYLGFHWFTDVLAGVCLGVLIANGVSRCIERFTPAVPRPQPLGTERYPNPARFRR